MADEAMSDLGDFRDRRIEAASAASARCELNLIRGMPALPRGNGGADYGVAGGGCAIAD